MSEFDTGGWHDVPSEPVSIRDQFAIAALSGLLASPSVINHFGRSRNTVDDKMLSDVTARAYQYADAMLAARMKGGDA